MTLKTITLDHPLNIRVEVIPAADLLREFGPRVLPPHWHQGQQSQDGCYWTYEPPYGRRFKVLMSAGREQDGRIWLHVSVSKWSPSGKTQELPDWDDLKLIKSIFIGSEREAYMVFPKASKYVNIGEVHHLWCPVDGPVLPDFTRGTNSL